MKRKQSKVISVLFKTEGDYLWGVIFRTHFRQGQGEFLLDSYSKPFVISRTIGTERVIYGIVETRLPVECIPKIKHGWVSTRSI